MTGTSLRPKRGFRLKLRHGYDVREARHANEAQYAAIPLLTGALV